MYRKSKIATKLNCHFYIIYVRVLHKNWDLYLPLSRKSSPDIISWLFHFLITKYKIFLYQFPKKVFFYFFLHPKGGNIVYSFTNLEESMFLLHLWFFFGCYIGWGLVGTLVISCSPAGKCYKSLWSLFSWACIELAGNDLFVKYKLFNL